MCVCISQLKETVLAVLKEMKRPNFFVNPQLEEEIQGLQNSGKLPYSDESHPFTSSASSTFQKIR